MDVSMLDMAIKTAEALLGDAVPVLRSIHWLNLF